MMESVCRANLVYNFIMVLANINQLLEIIHRAEIYDITKDDRICCLEELTFKEKKPKNKNKSTINHFRYNHRV